MTEKLKPCPFCGGKAVLEYSGVEVLRNCERGNIEMAWKVWCPNCGTEKRGGLTTYWLNNDATLTIASELEHASSTTPQRKHRNLRMLRCRDSRGAAGVSGV